MNDEFKRDDKVKIFFQDGSAKGATVVGVHRDDEGYGTVTVRFADKTKFSVPTTEVRKI